MVHRSRNDADHARMLELMSQRDLWSLVALLRSEALENKELAAAPPVREGAVFAYVLEHLPIGVSAETALAGELGWEWCLPAQAARWDRKQTASLPQPATAPSPRQLMYDRFHCHGSAGGDAHTTVDYERVVTRGLDDLLAQIEAESRDSAPDKRETLAGMSLALRGMIRFAERYAEAAEHAAASAADGAARLRLPGLAERCRRVPRLPARSFREALQSLWLVHLGVGLSEGSGSSLSLGRLDQYLLPFYEADLARGVGEPDLEAALADLFRALNAFFGDPACAVNLGGASATGEDQFNPLSRLIVRVAAQLHLPSPILAARIHARLPQEVFDLLTDPALLEMGQPTFYGEEPCRETLLRRGVPAGKVHEWAVNSCMGLVMPGQEWANMWGTVVNVLLPLELSLNRGRPFRDELPIALTTEAAECYETFDQLYETVCAYLGEITDLFLSETAKATENRGREWPNPFVSALLADCVRRGRDRLLGGCRTQTVTVEAFGLVNASDALVALRELVFEQERFTLAELVEAAKADFEGRPALLHALRQAPKFGNGDSAADAVARDLASRFARIVERHSAGNLQYLPSFHTLNAHLAAGAKTSASLDGRLSGTPLAKNIGTSPGRSTEGHTALLRSAATIDQRRFAGGQALDISVDLRTLSTIEDRRKFQALLKTYFALGGLQVQVNGLSPEVLRRAMDDPASYRDLLVRIAGFTARYVTLPREVQKEMVDRFAAGL